MSYFIVVSLGITIVAGLEMSVDGVEVSSTGVALAGVVSVPVSGCFVVVGFWQEIEDRSNSRRKYVFA